MRRREFITLVGGAAATWPLAARAQQPAKIPRIGFLGFGGAATWANRIAALQVGLSDLGYVEGKSIVIEFRWTERIEQLPDLATEFVGMKVDVIFARQERVRAPWDSKARRTAPRAARLLPQGRTGRPKVGHGRARTMGGEGVLIHPPHQGVCGRHGTEDQDVTPGELPESSDGTEGSDSISASETRSGALEVVGRLGSTGGAAKVAPPEAWRPSGSGKPAGEDGRGETESEMSKAGEVESSLSERPEHRRSRRLADWINPTGARKVG